MPFKGNGWVISDMQYKNIVRTTSFGVVREFVGHGIGKEMHEDPQVPNYGKAVMELC